MHIEDRLSILEKSAILEDKNNINSNLIDHTKRISKLENQSSRDCHNINSIGKEQIEQLNSINRLEKRTESTEAQIIKLFALVEECSRQTKPKNNLVDSTDTKQSPKEEYLNPVLATVTHMIIKCPHCLVTLNVNFSKGTRSIGLTDDGNIRVILYQFRCDCCCKKMTVQF